MNTSPDKQLSNALKKDQIQAPLSKKKNEMGDMDHLVSVKRLCCPHFRSGTNLWRKEERDNTKICIALHLY